MVRVLLKSFVAVSMLLTLFLQSCKEDDNSVDFKNGREVYMSNDVNIRIVLPDRKDTIYYKDISSGALMAFSGNELFGYYRGVKDTVRLHGELMRFKLDLINAQNFNITDSVNKIRVFSFDHASAILYLKVYDQFDETPYDVISLKSIPVSGRIEKYQMTYKEQYTPDLNFTEPYITVRYKGVLVPNG